MPLQVLRLETLIHVDNPQSPAATRWEDRDGAKVAVVDEKPAITRADLGRPIRIEEDKKHKRGPRILTVDGERRYVPDERLRFTPSRHTSCSFTHPFTPAGTSLTSGPSEGRPRASERAARWAPWATC